MTFEEIRRVLAWALVINWGILILWFLVFISAHDWLYRYHKKWFDLKTETFDALHYAGMAFFKLLILVFILAPYLAMHIIG